MNFLTEICSDIPGSTWGRSVLISWSFIHYLGALMSPFRAAAHMSYWIFRIIGWKADTRFFFFHTYILLLFFFSYTELLVVWGNYDFTKKHFWWLEESVTWSSPLLSLMPRPADLSFCQFLQELLFLTCLPNPLHGLWAAKPCLARGRACMTVHMAVGYSASPEQALKLDLVGKIFTEDVNIQLLFSQDGNIKSWNAFLTSGGWLLDVEP